MPQDSTPDSAFPVVTLHEFKNNISRYLTALEEGRYRAVILKRYGEKIAFVSPMNRKNE